MGAIFNQKEEVISVELTKHGRKLLGSGVFQPKYFSFFDDGITYDNSYAGISENINEIQDRILNKSITFRCLNLIDDTLKNPLGSSTTVNDYAPSWSIQVLNGGIVHDKNNSTYHTKIFDIEDIQYVLSTKKTSYTSLEPFLEGDYFLLDIDEINVDEDIENFEIELIAYDEISGGKLLDSGRKLYFDQKNNNIIDDILYEENELPNKFFEDELTIGDAAYYFDVLVDDEIDTDFIAAGKKLRAKPQADTGDVYRSTYTGPAKDPEC